MPRKTYRKKRNVKRPRRKRKTLSLRRSPMGTSFATKLRYYDTVSVNPGVGSLAYHKFAANGLYDPDLTGTGHQPRGFDQLMVMYNHYLVVGSKITITVHNSDANIPIVCGVYTSVDNQTTTAPRDFMEQAGRRYTVLAGDAQGGNNIKTLTAYASPKKMFNVANLKDNTNLRGYISANPTELLYYNLFAFSQNETSDPAACDFSVVIDYLVIFSEPNDLDAS